MTNHYYICSKDVVVYLDDNPYIPVHTFGNNATDWTLREEVGCSDDLYQLDYVLIANPSNELLTVLTLCGCKFMPVDSDYFTVYLTNVIEDGNHWIKNE